ncbi:MAG TPA: DNA mismatch repair endonuclease MutL [Bryobacteraceae bacterium]|nr:DNA mismatch repair endonuclease MutL [Bryobacteraceae bacterium]
MGRIRVLSDNVANKIAAGEVVERPASVAKELLENSLDAGATEVRIDVESAGRRLLRIDDNGIGMLRDDALLAFERHATSKLSDVKDLLAIATLGFRGEALPSIASVSRLQLETRAQEEQTGTKVEIAGGKLLRCDELARTVGTTISVRDLFYNVPARKKFLRSDQTELSHIGSLVTHYSLAHPDKRFELYHEGRELLQVTPVATMKERAFQVFGAGTMEHLVELEKQAAELNVPVPYAASRNSDPDAEAAEPSRFCLEGLVSGPHIQKLNRNSIFLFVNGRLIRDKLLLHAISTAFHNLMPAGSYPFALLFLTCDASEVDVNVHPSKTEVRFRHGAFVHDFVRDSIRNTLTHQRPASSIPFPAQSPMPARYNESADREPISRPFIAQQAPNLPFSEFSRMLDAQPAVERPSELRWEQPSARAHTNGGLPEIRIPAVQPVAHGFESQPLFEPKPQPPAIRRVPDTHGTLHHLPPEWEMVDSLAALPDLRPLGQLHESFIIAAGRDGLWIIDQHVAHERILFEKVLRQRAAGTAELQQLLSPIVLDLTVGQHLEYERIREELDAGGFETEPFGQRSIAIKAAPAGLSTGAIEQVIFEILEIAEQEMRGASLDNIRRDIAATIACRAAIKVNNKLEPEKVEYLLKALAQCEFPMTCPHGRPIALRYNTKDILRSFHRI